MRWSSCVWIKSRKETSRQGIWTASLAAEAMDNLNLQQMPHSAPINSSRMSIPSPFCSEDSGTVQERSKSTELWWAFFFSSKSPREQGTIPYSSAFTSSWTSPKHNYIIKQVIMHSCPRIFLERASLKVQNYRTLKLHYTPQKWETDWETESRTGWVVGSALHRACSQTPGEETRAPLALRDTDWYYWMSSRTGKTSITPIL